VIHAQATLLARTARVAMLSKAICAALALQGHISLDNLAIVREILY